jgi:hypothetical protein
MPLVINGEAPKPSTPIYKPRFAVPTDHARAPLHRTKPALARHAHGWDSYTYINTAVDLRLVRGFNLLQQSEGERRAPYTRSLERLIFPTDDPESAAAEEALENILDEDTPHFD